MLISVLLIEDDPDYADLVRFVMSQPNSSIRFDLHWERTLSSGLNYLSANRPDVILVDLGLPDSQGPQTVEKLALFAENTPVLALSAEDRDAAMWEVMRRGAEDHLVKADLEPDSLKVAIINAIAKHLERTTGTLLSNDPVAA